MNLSLFIGHFIISSLLHWFQQLGVEELHQTGIQKIKHTLEIVYHNLPSGIDTALTQEVYFS